jgi:hypothetical protein
MSKATAMVYAEDFGESNGKKAKMWNHDVSRDGEH